MCTTLRLVMRYHWYIYTNLMLRGGMGSGGPRTTLEASTRRLRGPKTTYNWAYDLNHNWCNLSEASSGDYKWGYKPRYKNLKIPLSLEI